MSKEHLPEVSVCGATVYKMIMEDFINIILASVY